MYRYKYLSVFTTEKSPQGIEIVFPTEVEIFEILIMPTHQHYLTHAAQSCRNGRSECPEQYVFNQNLRNFKF